MDGRCCDCGALLFRPAHRNGQFSPRCASCRLRRRAEQNARRARERSKKGLRQ
jgi:hypothetical protein